MPLGLLRTYSFGAMVSPPLRSQPSPGGLRDPMFLSVSPVVYNISWCLILLFHAVHAALLARANYSLIRTIRRPLRTTELLRAVGVEFNASVSYLSVVCAFAVSVFHVYEIWRLIRASISARRLSLISYELYKPPKSTGHESSSCSSVWVQAVNGFRYLRWLCGTRGPYFEHAYHTREVFEIVLQSVQAYRVSYFVSHVWTNQLAASVIVLNCWSSPVIYWIFRNAAAKRRMSCLAVDVILDFTSSLVIPYTIYFKYRTMLPQEDMFDPIWVQQVANDVQQFTNTSLFDVVFRMSAAVSMILSLQTMQALLRPRQQQSYRSIGLQTAVAPGTTGASVPKGATAMSAPNVAVLTSQRGRRWIRVSHFALLFYGLGVIAVYSRASFRASDKRAVPGCRLAMRKWLAGRYPCAVLEINCHARQISGLRDEVSTALTQVDKYSLSVLILSHCNDLTVPPAILRFPNLVWLELYNSTLTDWPADATPVDRTSRHLSRVLFIHVNLTSPGLPLGLLPSSTAVYPHSLRQFVFVGTKLTSLPVDLFKHWDPSRVESVILEDCGFDRVPEALQSFHLSTLSLANNKLVALPPWIFTNRRVSYTAISVAGNPLSTWPVDISPSEIFTNNAAVNTRIRGVHVEFTNLTSLSSWAIDSGVCTSVQLFAFGSPLCSDASLTNASCDASTTFCALPPVPPRTIGRLFPIDLHEARRRVDGSLDDETSAAMMPPLPEAMTGVR